MLSRDCFCFFFKYCNCFAVFLSELTWCRRSLRTACTTCTCRNKYFGTCCSLFAEWFVFRFNQKEAYYGTVCNVRQSRQDSAHFKYFTFSAAPKQELCTSSLYTRPKLKHEQWTLTPHSHSQRLTVAGCPSVWSPFQPPMTETALTSLHWLCQIYNWF